MQPALVFSVSEIGECTPLPLSVKEKWTNWQDSGKTSSNEPREVILQRIEDKLHRARCQREMFKNWVLMPRRGDNAATKRARSSNNGRDSDDLCKKLQAKQEYAEKKRVDRLSSIQLRARERERRRQAVKRRVQQRIADIESHLSQHLREAEERRALRLKRRVVAAQTLSVPRTTHAEGESAVSPSDAQKQSDERRAAAAAAREALIRTIAAKAGQRFHHAKSVSQAQREAEAEHVAALKSASKAKLEAAEARRTLFLSQLSAAHAGRAPDAFLRSRAARRERLRQSAYARSLQICWRTFQKSCRTTSALAQAVIDTSLPGVFYSFARVSDSDSDAPPPGDIPPPADGVVMLTGFGRGRGMPWQQEFDKYSAFLQASTTIKPTKDLLQRLELRFKAAHPAADSSGCDRLLARLFPRAARSRAPIDRYPVRIFLCAYMMNSHPDILFSGGEFDDRVRASADSLINAFEILLLALVTPVPSELGASSFDGSVDDERGGASSPGGGPKSKRLLLEELDEKWVAFLEIFVAWKGADAASIERDLLRIGVEMQESMLTACGGDINSARVRENPHLQAIVRHVQHDHALLRQRLERLRGLDAAARFDARIAAVRVNPPSSPPPASPPTPPPAEESVTEHAHAPPQRRVSFSRQLVTQRDGVPVMAGWRIPTAEDPDGANGAARGSADSSSPPSHQERMMHQLLVNPAWRPNHTAVEERWRAVLEATGDRVPVPNLDLKQDGDRLAQHVRFIAEDALVEAALHGMHVADSDAAGGEVAAVAVTATMQKVISLLADIADEVLDIIPRRSPQVQELTAAFDRDHMEGLLSGAVGLEGQVAVLTSLMQQTARMLQDLGAPARVPVAEAALERLGGMLREALGGGSSRSDSYSAVAACLARALRMLLMQLHMLRADAAQAQLTMLALSMTPAQAAAYAADKFCRRHAVADSMPAAALQGGLPITHAFAQSSPPPTHLAPLLHSLQSLATTHTPTELRSGTRPPANTPASIPGSLAAEPLQLTPTAIDAWQARFRCAVAALMLQPVTLAENPSLPEVLFLDGVALDDAKGKFQTVLVIAVSLQCAAAVAAAGGQGALSAAQLAALERRLAAVEVQKPEGGLRSVQELLADACGTSVEAAASVVQAVLAPNSPALHVMCSKLLHVMQAVLVRAPAGVSASGAGGVFVAPQAPPAWAECVLPRLGLLPIYRQLGEVVHTLGRVSAVAEAVHGQYLGTIFSGSA